jgi:hypothetical protein
MAITGAQIIEERAAREANLSQTIDQKRTWARLTAGERANDGKVAKRWGAVSRV